MFNHLVPGWWSTSLAFSPSAQSSPHTVEDCRSALKLLTVLRREPAYCPTSSTQLRRGSSLTVMNQSQIQDSIPAPIRNLRGQRASAEALRAIYYSLARQVAWQYAKVNRGFSENVWCIAPTLNSKVCMRMRMFIALFFSLSAG